MHKSEEMANKILDELASGYSTPTQTLFGNLGLENKQHNWARRILMQLIKADRVTCWGEKKKRWRRNGDNWDRNRPFGDAGIPKGSGPRAAGPMIDEVQIKTIVANELNDKFTNLKGELIQSLQPATLVDDAVAKVLKEMGKRGVIKQEIHVKINELKPVKLEGTVHVAFKRALRLASRRKNILFIGPAGAGKSHLARQIAEALGLDFGHISCTAGMSEGAIVGRQLPVGKGGAFEYVRSEFVRLYEEGGVFLFDEIDAADSNTLLIVNSALANGEMVISNRHTNPIAKKHKDFVCMANANTFGTGADRQYVGRNQLDESTLDRFRIGQVEMDYDKEIEAVLCPDKDLREKLWAYRQKARDAKLRRVVSTRFLKDAYDMIQAGDTMVEIEESLFAGWSKDELSKVGKY